MAQTIGLLTVQQHAEVLRFRPVARRRRSRRMMSAEICVISCDLVVKDVWAPARLLRGRTVRPEHLRLIRQMFDLPLRL